MDKENISLSLCMIVRNEAENLCRCLDSIKDIADEIIIIDTGSTDETKVISREYTDRIYDYSWRKDFSAARNYATSLARGNWILTLDADEVFEREDKTPFLELLNNLEVDGYYFPTISFVGERPGVDAIVNMNLRLFRNSKEYQYTGRVYEEINTSIIKNNPEAKLLVRNVRIYHYGYLAKELMAKEKRMRNIELLELMLEENQEKSNVLYNLGNEYFASDDYKNAYAYYEKALEGLAEISDFGSRLFLRIVLCSIGIKDDVGSLEYIDIGIKKFPKQTDFLFLKGVVLKLNNEQDKAIDCFKQCIEMGEAPLYLRFVEGVGSYKAYCCLGDIYSDQNKYDLAFQAYSEAIKYSLCYERALEKLIDTVYQLTDSEGAREIVEGILSPVEPINSYFLSKAYYKLKRYSLALFYINKIQEAALCNEGKLLKGKIYFYSGEFNRSKTCFSGLWDKERECIDYLQLYLLSCLLVEDYEDVEFILAQIQKQDKSGCFYCICNALYQIIIGSEEIDVLSEETHKSKEYTDIIFDILTLLLDVKAPSFFEKARSLLSLVNDSSALLRLGKLYYYYGYEKLAEEEIARSIKLYNVCDEEGRRILGEIYKES